MSADLKAKAAGIVNAAGPEQEGRIMGQNDAGGLGTRLEGRGLRKVERVVPAR